MQRIGHGSARCPFRWKQKGCGNSGRGLLFVASTPFLGSLPKILVAEKTAGSTEVLPSWKMWCKFVDLGQCWVVSAKVVAEVHDIDGRLQRIQQLLQLSSMEIHGMWRRLVWRRCCRYGVMRIWVTVPMFGLKKWCIDCLLVIGQIGYIMISHIHTPVYVSMYFRYFWICLVAVAVPWWKHFRHLKAAVCILGDADAIHFVMTAIEIKLEIGTSTFIAWRCVTNAFPIPWLHSKFRMTIKDLKIQQTWTDENQWKSHAIWMNRSEITRSVDPLVNRQFDRECYWKISKRKCAFVRDGTPFLWTSFHSLPCCMSWPLPWSSVVCCLISMSSTSCLLSSGARKQVLDMFDVYLRQKYF